MNIDNNKSIAVLPFVNMSSNKEAEYFSDGITEEIINALGKIQELQVTSRTSSFTFKNSPLKISEIGEKLNVSVILEGSIRLSGSTARISVQLIEAKSEFQFWSDSFDRNLKNVFEVQDEISLIIADKLRENIGHFDLSEHLVDSYNVSFETYKKYLKGRFYLMKLDYNNTLKAISIFEEVIAESPDFPLPYLDINQGYTYMGTMGIIPPFEGFMKAQPFLEKAIQLKEDLPETQLNLSWISFWQNWDSEKAYRHLNKALSLKPTDPMYITMANFLTIEGKLDLAVKYTDKALELAPFSSVNINYKGFLHYLSGRYNEALPFFLRSLDIQPELPFPVVNIGACHLLLGNHEDALSYFANLPIDNTGYLAKLGGTTIVHAATGNNTDAYHGIRELESYLDTPSVGNAINFLILAHAQLNNIEKAIDYIKMAIENRFPLVLLLPSEPLAATLHDLPEFKKLIGGILNSTQSLEAIKKESVYKKELFSTQEIEQYKSRLKGLMENENLYLNPELTLRSLADYMNLPANHMSQLLNKGLSKNFSDYINTYRLEDFKSKLKNSNAHKLTLLALAYDSGFNSKTVFNTFFKKKVGMTPKAYFKQISSDL